MASIFGTELPLPDFSLTGFFSSSWIYVFIIFIVGAVLVLSIIVLLFYKTYGKKIIVFENISGQGYQPVLKTRARIVKLGLGGEEVLKTFGGVYVSAYGRKMGKNVYWFAKGSDGYWYNCVLGDLDTKLGILDIEPIDRDMRMFHVALDRLSHLTYGKQSFMEKYAVHMLLFVFLIVLILGMWFIVGKVGESTSALAATAETNREVVVSLSQILEQSNNIKSSGTSGVVPAT